MSEFRVTLDKASQGRRDGKIRIAVWGVVLLLLVTAIVGVLSVRLSNPHVNTAFTWLAISIVAGAIVGAHLLATRLGLEKLERDTIFLLTEEDVVRRRAGWPDVRIGLSEITSLIERRNWLVVEGAESTSRIAIPREVDGFATLRAELAKHCSITVQPTRSLVELIPIIASLLCWGTVFWLRDATVVRVAAATALVLLAWESFRLYSRLRQNPKRLLGLLWIALGWVAAILVVYFRLLRLS
jgi:hypothetical protein